tara:strand:- start:288 stop:455 length:168 start_codon:yes stop_codon:yes gene_type:complete
MLSTNTSKSVFEEEALFRVNAVVELSPLNDCLVVVLNPATGDVPMNGIYNPFSYL